MFLEGVLSTNTMVVCGGGWSLGCLLEVAGGVRFCGFVDGRSSSFELH